MLEARFEGCKSKCSLSAGTTQASIGSGIDSAAPPSIIWQNIPYQMSSETSTAMIKAVQAHLGVAIESRRVKCQGRTRGEGTSVGDGQRLVG